MALNDFIGVWNMPLTRIPDLQDPIESAGVVTITTLPGGGNNIVYSVHLNFLDPIWNHVGMGTYDASTDEISFQGQNTIGDVFSGFFKLNASSKLMLATGLMQGGSPGSVQGGPSKP